MTRFPVPFLVLATENPIELEGTFALPEAQLDRFLVRVRLGYPSRVDEGRVGRRYRDSVEPLDAVTMVAPPEQLSRCAKRSEPSTLALRSRTTRRSRSSDSRAARVAPGSSPRSSVALYRATQARAFLAGRDFALPDDVKALVLAVLGHRILLDIDRELRGIDCRGCDRSRVGVGGCAAGPGRDCPEPGLTDGPQRLHRADCHRRRSAHRCRRAGVRGRAHGACRRAPVDLVALRTPRPPIRTAPVRSPGPVGRAARSRPGGAQRQTAATSLAAYR